MHRKAERRSTIAEIYEWFAKNLHQVPPSVATALRAGEEGSKAAGMDRTDVLAVEAENKQQQLAA